MPDYERKSNYGWLALNNDKLFSFVSYQAHCNTDMKIVLLYPPPQKKKKKKKFARKLLVNLKPSILNLALHAPIAW